MNDKLNQYTDKLNRKVWITKGSRFEASRKLSLQSQLSITSISFLSIYAIGISIIQNIIDLTGQCRSLNNLYTITAILLSVFILVLSLLEGLKNYQLRAERLYNNAKDLSKLYGKIDYLLSFELEHKNLNEQQKFIEPINNEYNELIDRCQENHDSDDYWLFKAKHLKDFPEDFKNIGCVPIGWPRSCWIQISYIIKHYWLYMISIALPLPLFIWLYYIFRC
ncbi:MAG: SLATT domain-containing protein [Crocosphaera sp.]|nr:SLATT domain-containing protein [Crocosphaera sp.]